MRRETIEQIKTFLRDTPNFRDRIDEMHLNAIISGATEEEFAAAVKELTPPAPAKETIKPFMKKMIAYDAVVHVFFLVIAVAGISYLTSLMTSKSFPHFLTNAGQKASVAPDAANNPDTLIPQVYANGAVLQSEKVFSYPASPVTLTITGTPQKEVFGFLPYWMMKQVENINLTGLTSVSFFGLEMDGGGNIVTRYDDGEMDQGWEMWNDPEIDRAIRSLRSRKIKTQITLKAFNNQNIEHLVSSDKAQQTFIANAVHMVNSKGLDGLTIDFEYIGTPPKGVSQNFTRFMTNLHTELKRQVPDATLSLATYVNAAAYPGFFDITALSDSVDDFIIMGYDFHTPKGSPGPVAPMEGTISLKGFMQSYLEKVPPGKLILALAHYGYDWPVNEKNESLGYADMLSYAEIAYESNQATLYWDETAQTPFYQYRDPETSQNRVVHFENTRSLGIKYDYINEKNLKGVGIWALGYDGINNDLRSVLLDKFVN